MRERDIEELAARVAEEIAGHASSEMVLRDKTERAPEREGVTMPLNESTVETAALAWFEALGYSVCKGLEIAPGELAAERTGYAETILARRFREALARLNPELPAEALDDAFRKVSIPQHPSLLANNRAFHCMLADGIPVECRRPDGSIGTQIARLVDFQILMPTTGLSSTSSP